MEEILNYSALKPKLESNLDQSQVYQCPSVSCLGQIMLLKVTETHTRKTFTISLFKNSVWDIYENFKILLYLNMYTIYSSMSYSMDKTRRH